MKPSEEYYELIKRGWESTKGPHKLSYSEMRAFAKVYCKEQQDTEASIEVELIKGKEYITAKIRIGSIIIAPEDVITLRKYIDG